MATLRPSDEAVRPPAAACIPAAGCISTAAAPAREPWRAWAALVLLISLLAWAPALRDGLLHDDGPQVERLAPVHTFSEWLSSWRQPWWPPNFHKNLWRPVTRWAILAEQAAFGRAPLPYHGVSLALAAGASLLLLATGRRLGLGARGAGLGALLFAVHPVATEAVHQVVGQAELLAALFMLLGLWLFLRRAGPLAAAQYFLQPLCFALALGAKEHAMVYPVLLLLAAPRGGSRRRLALLLALLAAVFAVFLGLKGWVTGGLIEPAATVLYLENPLARLSFFGRLPAVLGIFGFAATRLVWPLGLGADYSAFSFPFERGWAWGWSWAGAALALALVGWIVRDARRGGRGWRLAAAALAAYGLISNGPFVIGTVMAERLWFWPMAPACLGLGWVLAAGGARLAARGRAGLRAFSLIAVLLMTGLLAATWRYAPAWRTQLSLVEWTLDRFPDSWRGHNNLAREAYNARDFTTGLAAARRATALLPAMGIAWDWRGLNAMFLPGQGAEAEAAFARALALDPALTEVYRHQANLFEAQGRSAAAAGALERYLAQPDAQNRPQLQARLNRLRAAKGAGS